MNLLLKKMYKIMFLACAAVISFSAHAYRGEDSSDDNKEQDLARCEVGESVYDQTDIVNDPAFTQAKDMCPTVPSHFADYSDIQEDTCTAIPLLTEDQKKNILEAAFHKKVGNALFWNGLSGISTEAASTLAFFLTLYRLPTAWQSTLGLSALPFVFPLIYQLKIAGSGLYKSYISGNEKSELSRLEKQYIRIKPSFTQSLQEFVDKTLIQSYCTGSKEGREFFLKKVKLVLDLPKEIKNIEADKTVLDKTFAGYSPEIQNQLKRFCTFRDTDSKTKIPTDKSPFYFYGCGGVGKTKAVELIAEALHVPYVRIKLPSSLAQLEGTANEPGMLLEALTQTKYQGKGYKNMIIFIDEADKIMNFDPEKNPNPELKAIQAFLLDLFDPKQSEIKMPYLGGKKVDIAHIGFIVAGNAPLQYVPLRNRFTVNNIEFPPFTTEQKLKLFDMALLDEELKFRTPDNAEAVVALQKSDLIPEDYAAMKSIITEDNDPGLRSEKQYIHSYIENLVACRRASEDRHACSNNWLQGTRALKPASFECLFQGQPWPPKSQSQNMPAQPGGENAPAINSEALQLLMQILAAKKQQEALEQKLKMSMYGK